MADPSSKSALGGIVSQLPVDRLRQEAQDFGQAITQQGLSKASKGVESVTGKLNDYAQGGSTATKAAANVAQGDSPVKAGVKATASKVKDTVKEKLGMGGGNGGKLKVTNILESVDVPVPRDVAYAQWTQFEDFPTFMKKVENVKQEEDEKLTWKAQIFWSHRSWDAEIVDQVPNERIVWKSDGEKGRVDGAITFHELAPDLTRILMTLEYHPKGFFEHTGNIWRAQGRRARLELKHFARHVSTQTLLHQDELDGWEGEIHDGDVTEGEDKQEDEKPTRRRPRRATKRSSTSRSTAKKSTATQSTRSRSTAKKAPAKKSTAKKAPAKKTTSASRSTAKKTAAASKAPAKKSTATQSTRSRSAAKKSPAKKSPAKKAPAKKSTTKASSARKRTTKASAR